MQYNVAKAQEEFEKERIFLSPNNVSEQDEAILFTKKLVEQSIPSSEILSFCQNGDIYVTKSLIGYTVVGYYFDINKNKHKFNVSITKVNGVWRLAKEYNAADTKAGSHFILLFIGLSIGCSLVGLLMYYLISLLI